MKTHNLSLFRKAKFLSYFTVAYNLGEAAVSIFFGYRESSIALIGFGLDSLIESLSAIVMIWRLGSGGDELPEEIERRETRALRIIGVTFFLFAGYVLYESGTALLFREMPDRSLPGIIIAAVSLIIMPILYKQKFAVGKKLGMRSLIADSKETLACSYLSASLLVGLGLRYVLGWWWADPVTGLVVAGFLIKEGFESFEDEGDDD